MRTASVQRMSPLTTYDFAARNFGGIRQRKRSYTLPYFKVISNASLEPRGAIMTHTTLRKTAALIAFLMSGALAACAFGAASVKVPPPAFDAPKEKGDLQTAVLAGGCFW